jgi:hypothetical protein
VHRDLEALALVADQVRRGDAYVVEEELPGGTSLDAHLLFELRDLHTPVLLHHERGDAAVARAGIGLREHDVDVGDAGVRDPDLRAREDV